MSDRRLNQASQDFTADLSALRDDIANLTGSVSDLLKARANDAAGQASGIFGRARDRAASRAADARDQFADRAAGARDEFVSRAYDARDRFSSQASDVQDRLGSLGSDIETKIERNPLTAVVVAGIAGLLMGMLSRSF